MYAAWTFSRFIVKTLAPVRITRSVPIFRRIEIISLTFRGKHRRKRQRRRWLYGTRCVIRGNRDHVFGCHKSHYHDGSVPSARRRVIVFSFRSFCPVSFSATGISTGRRTHTYIHTDFSFSVSRSDAVTAKRNCIAPRRGFVFLVALSPMSFETRALSLGDTKRILAFRRW